MDEPSPEPPSFPQSEGPAFFLAQYTALREEMVKQIELRNQPISFALIAFGSLAAAMAQKPTAPFLFLYPILAAFLSTAWSYHARVIRQIGYFIWKQVEGRLASVRPPRASEFRCGSTTSITTRTPRKSGTP